MLLAAGLAAAQLGDVSTALAQPKGGAAAPSQDATKKALDLFKKGQALFNKDKFGEALPLFRESYALVASPNSQIYIARCLTGTGDSVGAYLEYNALIADVDARNDPKYAPARENAVKERDDVAGKIGLLTVTVSGAAPGTRLSVAGHDIASDKWGKPIPVAPGSVEVSVVTPPGVPQTQQVELHAGEKKDFSIAASGAPSGTATTTAPPGSRAWMRPVSYAAAGVGVAGFIVFGITGGLATSAYSELDKKCGPGSATRACPSDLKSTIDNGKTEQTLANVGLVVGAVGLATGVTLFVLSRTGKKDDAPKQSLVVGPSYVGVHGTF